jgi:hypothetical protein
MGKIGKP